MAARAEVRMRGLRPRREQLGVEVTPAELPYERLCSLSPERTLDHLQRREAAEVQTRAEPRGAVGGERVVQAFVLADAARQPAREAPPPLRLASAGQLGRRRAAHQSASAGNRPLASRAGIAICLGAGARERRGAGRQRRQYGVKTLK